MKYYFLIFSLLVSLNAKSQQEEDVEIYSQDTERYDDNYPNTNIGKGSFAMYVGLGPMAYTGNLENYFKPDVCGTASLDLYFPNNLTFSLSVMGTTTFPKKDITINKKLWTPSDTVDFQSYGFYFGHSVLNTVHWRINPFGGVVLSHTKFTSPDGKNKYRIGPEPSPVMGLNFSYRFINVKKRQRNKNYGENVCLGINARIVYVPLAVYKNNAPFLGGIRYMTIGLTMNMFGTD